MPFYNESEFDTRREWEVKVVEAFSAISGAIVIVGQTTHHPNFEADHV
jgi:hypothetical protein